MADIAGSITEVFDYTWNRFSDRLAGLTDEEYFWEPVDGCWNLRPGADGRWVLDGGGYGIPPDPAPITTIAWRIGHMVGMGVGGFADRLFGGEVGPGRPLGDGDFPSTAAAVPEFLATRYGRWRDGMTSLPEERWWAALGPAWGPYAEDSTYALVLHVLDEIVHHAAEVGLMRDLYQHRATLRPAV